MATAKKTTTSKRAKAKKVVEDAVIVEEAPKVEDSKVADDKVEAEKVSEEAGAETKVDPVDAADTKDAPVKRKSAFMPMLLGGVVSGAIGFGGASAYFINQPSEEAQALVQVQTTLGAQKAQLDAAGASLAGLRSGLEQSAAAQETADGFAQALQRDDALVAQVETVTAMIAEFEVRLLTLEKRPLAEAGGITGDAAKAYERELRTMRDLLETQRSDIEKLVTEATARIESVAQLAATTEIATDATAKETTVMVAVSQLQMALDHGVAFPTQIAGLVRAGVQVPETLVSAAKAGVLSLESLQSSFPAAARAGLSASVKATSGDGAMDKIGSFFRSQVGARSLKPREGDDADAVLSRAEAALTAGDIMAAVGLISALPEQGQAAMAEWVSAANARVEAVEALRVLADDLNGN